MIVATFALLALAALAVSVRLWGRHDFASVLSGLVGLLAFAIAMIAPTAAELAIGAGSVAVAAVVVIGTEWAIWRLS